MKSNRLCKAVVPNNNRESNFSEFVLSTLREYNDYSGGTYIDEIKNATDFLEDHENAVDQPFYRVYGLYKDSLNKSNKLKHLSDFFDLDDAINFMLDLTGTVPSITYY
jgi:hypothetical protein